MPSPLQAGASFADVLARIVRPEKFVPWARRYFAGDTSVIPNPAMVLLDRGALADVAEHRRAGGAV